MPIYETERGTFRVRWYDQHGKQHSQTFATRGAATTFHKQVEGDVSKGTYVDRSSGRISLSAWISECRETDFGLQPGTVETEERAAKHINEVLGDFQLCNLNSTDIEKYIATRLKAGASPGYVAMEFRYLRKWLKRAVTKERIVKTPLAGVQAPAPEDTEMRFLTYDELVCLAENIQPRYRAWVYTLGLVGLRFSEANGLRRRNLKLLQRKLDVVEQMVWDRNDRCWVRKKRLKTKSSRRSITIASPLLELLGEHLGRWSQEGDDGLVFPNKLGNPIGASSFRKNSFKPAVEAAGIDLDFRIHDLRHTAVALAIAEGAHPTAIMRRMGHSSITVTLDTYGHLFPELDETLADRLGTKLQTALDAKKIVLPFQKAS